MDANILFAVITGVFCGWMVSHMKEYITEPVLNIFLRLVPEKRYICRILIQALTSMASLILVFVIIFIVELLFF